MELLDRYLQAVRKYLPWERQNDIIAELRANLESQLEDREGELGRPLTPTEAEAWLKQLGSPVQMASRYQRQQYLIGPAVFPLYWMVLRRALGIALVVYGIVSVVLIATQEHIAGVDEFVGAVAAAIARTPGILMVVAAWVTLIFALLEWTAARYPEKLPPAAAEVFCWSPGSLPPLESLGIEKKPRRSFAHAAAQVIVEFCLMVWLLLIPGHPFLLMGPGVVVLQISPYQLAPIVWVFYWWVVGLNAVQLVWHTIDLARGAWQEPQRIRHVAIKAMGLIPLGVLLSAPAGLVLVLKNPAAADAAGHRATLESANNGIHIGLLVISAIAVLQLLWDLGRIGVDAWRQREVAMR